MNGMLTTIMLLFSMLFNLTTVPTPVEYTNVLEDLKQDSTFKESDYPSDSSKRTLDVIQIAISDLNDLFVYVYEPGAESYGLSIASINLSFDADYKVFDNYKLKVINSKGQFSKCKVMDYKLSNEKTHYIGISSIYRSYDPDLGDTDTTAEVGYKVKQKWLIDETNGKPEYYMNYLETYEIVDPYVGWIRYDLNANIFHNHECHGHYIAFKEDPKYKIDKLMEADVSYDMTSYSIFHTAIGDKPSEGYPKKEHGKTTLKYDDVVQIENDYKFRYFKRTFDWNRISTVDHFIKNENSEKEVLNAEKQKELRKYDWVLRFLETDYIDDYVPVAPGQPAVNHTEKYSLVDNISIMRLKFEQDGRVYNLPVICDKKHQQENPDGNNSLVPDMDSIIQAFGKDMQSMWEKMKLFLMVILGVALIPVAVIVLKVVIYPFKLIAKLFKIAFGKKDK